jgi:hypothetical protein
MGIQLNPNPQKDVHDADGVALLATRSVFLGGQVGCFGG